MQTDSEIQRAQERKKFREDFFRELRNVPASRLAMVASMIYTMPSNRKESEDMREDAEN